MTNLAGLKPRRKAERERFTPKERRFNAWMHDYGRCCLSARPDFEIAHTGRIEHGKGMARKASLNTCLPLQWLLHKAEERDREGFWSNAGFPGNDRFAWSERLFDIFEAGDDPTDLLMDMHERADLLFVGGILRGSK